MRRFQQVEEYLQVAGQKLSETDLDTLDYYWERAKEQDVSR